MTTINVNNFVARSDADFLLLDGEGYEISIKKLDNKQVAKFHCGHTQFMEVVNKYGLKPVWNIWENVKDESGKIIQGKGKYKPVN